MISHEEFKQAVATVKLLEYLDSKRFLWPNVVVLDNGESND